VCIDLGVTTSAAVYTTTPPLTTPIKIATTFTQAEFSTALPSVDTVRSTTVAGTSCQFVAYFFVLLFLR